MNFKNLSRARFSKLRNGIIGVGEFRYDTMCSQNLVSIGWRVWKLLGGGKILHRHTHRHTQRQTHRHTHTQTHRRINTEAYFISFVFLRKCRNKTKNRSRAHSPTFPSLHLRHSPFSNPSVALPTPQLILQPFRCFTYITAHSPTLLSLLLSHRHMT